MLWSARSVGMAMSLHASFLIPLLHHNTR